MTKVSSLVLKPQFSLPLPNLGISLSYWIDFFTQKP